MGSCAGRRQYHGNDFSRSRDWDYAPAPLLWWHKYDLHLLCNWPNITTFVLY